MRKPFVAGNWKMNLTPEESAKLVGALKETIQFRPEVEVAVCPTFVNLTTVADAVKGTPIALGGQNLFWRDSGAYTGQIAPGMLTAVGCAYVILGHSETRGRFGVPDEELVANQAYFSETEATLKLKLAAAAKHGLKPILCVGETLAEREAGQTDAVIAKQLEGALSGLSAEQTADLVVAYEPVWAIGTGKVCDTPEAERVCGVVRSELAKLLGGPAADGVRVLYGGSVKGSNAADLLSQPNIDGALVGGAALDAADFAKIVASA